MNRRALLEPLQSKPAAFWQELLRTWLLEKPSAAVIGRPSTTLAAALAAEEKARVAERQAVCDVFSVSLVCVQVWFLCLFPAHSSSNFGE